MIKHIDVSSPQKSYEIDADLSRYIQKKIGKLDKFMRKQSRQDARADVKVKESTGKGGKKCTCEVVLHFDGDTMTASESTMNMFAAVDIVEQKLRNQLKRNKEKSHPHTEKHLRSKARTAFGKIFSR